MRTITAAIAEFVKPGACFRPVANRLQRCAASRYIQMKLNGNIMRAEIQNIVEEIKQSVGLLRRHL